MSSPNLLQMEAISVSLFILLGVSSLLAVYSMSTYAAGIFMGCVAVTHWFDTLSAWRHGLGMSRDGPAMRA